MVYNTLKSLLAVLFVFLTSLSFSQENSRWIELTGARNVRDVGGLEIQTGETIRKGLIFRSDRLTGATAEDCTILQSLGLKTVIDLRSQGEVMEAPDSNCIHESMDYIHFPIDIRWFPTLEEVYLDIITTYAPSVAGALKEMAKEERLPLLFHCTAGKDRTGITTALLYLILGLEPEEIMHDYLLSNERGYYVDQAWLQAVFQRIEQEGGITPFLEQRGVSQKEQESIRTILLYKETSVKNWSVYKTAAID